MSFTSQTPEATEQATTGFAAAETVLCPTCRARQPWSDTCRRCQCDLTLLRQAAGTCRFYHRQCLLELKAGRINAALHHARRGYTFFPNPNSERLLAICCMIAGQWSEALTLAHWADKEP